MRAGLPQRLVFIDLRYHLVACVRVGDGMGLESSSGPELGMELRLRPRLELWIRLWLLLGLGLGLGISLGLGLGLGFGFGFEFGFGFSFLIERGLIELPLRLGASK